ncbi:unnamed protein product [Phytophthora fragariaefolia]|uniref:Unnamed protein product n=1 Tax=Phytophthora fragariaefolia TaxID=1490495 RepID=A0A9W6XV37_9STRA|nr:unnamed protein product [Phytophthora fragariaefolia]
MAAGELKSERVGAQEPLSTSPKASNPRRESSLKSPKTGMEGERMATRNGSPVAAPSGRDSTTTAEEMTNVDTDGDDRTGIMEIETEVRGRQRTNSKETASPPRHREGSRRILQAKRYQGVSVSLEKTATVDMQEEKSPSPTQVRQTSLTRRSSLSPKRRTPEDWDFAEQDFDMERQEPNQAGGNRDDADRSASPPKRLRGIDNTTQGKQLAQKLMHQFVCKAAGKGDPDPSSSEGGWAGNNGRPTPAKKADVVLTGGDECEVIKVTQKTDGGAKLEAWLEMLGARIADVATNGQCGWLAFYASLYNVTDGLMEPDAAVTEAANALKKSVMNGMLANLHLEARLHPQDIKAEVMAIGGDVSRDTTMEAVLSTLAEHYAEQRKRSVKAAVPLHFWVRPAHLKAMAQYARETVYVLDVREQGSTWLQAYAYAGVADQGGEEVETGTVTPMDTRVAMKMLHEMVANGVMPPCMVLQWRETGNHFQTLTYDEVKYKAYADNLPAMVSMRNSIRVRHGEQALDAVPYDELKNARAAAQTLKVSRKKSKRRRHNTKQHQDDRTIGITTVNVQGLAMQRKRLWMKLQGLKEQHERGQRDITFLQETHLLTTEEEMAAGQYAAMWGFKQQCASHFSFWSSGAERRAGVAILANPYGAYQHLEPWGQHYWSEHLIMVKGTLAGQVFLFVNVYAPSLGAARIKFMKSIQTISFPQDWVLICGGDFNCVVDRELDRIGGKRKADIGASELARLVDREGLIDTGYGAIGTSRLDRFYIRASVRRWVRGVVTEESPCQADHRAVLLELHSPLGAIRTKKRGKLYPPPAYVSTAISSVIKAELQVLDQTLRDAEPGRTAVVWQDFKTEHVRLIRKLKKQARERVTNGYRLRIKRLKQKLRKLEGEVTGAHPERTAVLDAIARLQTDRRASRKRGLVARSAWSSKQSTKHFFRRICTKFGDNTIPTLRQATFEKNRNRRADHDKSNIMADSWLEILNGQADEEEDIASYIAQFQDQWKRIDLTEIDADITEDEVAEAIRRCKPGKAVGPDELGKEWYRDHADELVPILTKLFNDCMAEGSLLNTDYKLLTRILAWRVRRYIAELVHSTQFGFVPGRTIHEDIDLLEAAKEQCRRGGELTQAQVLLLDFAKAYDSLDRDFLMAVIKAKGFPPKFCRMIKVMHSGTTVQFMVNGALSEKVVVIGGIRQGCPLAPLLFILAVDLLYDEVEATRGLVGVMVGCKDRGSHLKVAGYADDTAIYIQHRRMQDTAIRAVARFSAVSGLRLNVGKSAAIALGGSDRDDAGRASDVEQQISETSCVRYLGHIAGEGDTTEEAWRRAMGSLKVRLALAEAKTNTVIQRAAIAAAIIILKLLYALAPSKATAQVMHGHVTRLRRLMRFRNGMTTRWGQAGLVIQCAGTVQDALLTAQRERRKLLGVCRQWAVENTPWADLYPCDGQGVRQKWSTYAKVLGTMTNKPLRSVLRIEQAAAGLVFKPIGSELPLEPRVAHLFRELCIIVLANYPELVTEWTTEATLFIHTGRAGAPKVISVDPEQEGRLTIQTETKTQSVLWSPEEGNLQQEVAKALERYKALISKANEALVRRTKERIDEGWKASNAAIAEALEQLSWTRVHTMEGVTAYMTQNIVKLKLGRLLIWAGKELGFRCARADCQSTEKGGIAHLIWECSEAQNAWGLVRRFWTQDKGRRGDMTDDDTELLVRDIFSFSLAEVPGWLRRWGEDNADVHSDDLKEVAGEMWALGCAVITTGIWRRNVDWIHMEADERGGGTEVFQAMATAVHEAFLRYRMSLYPLTQYSIGRIRVADVIVHKWGVALQNELRTED